MKPKPRFPSFHERFKRSNNEKRSLSPRSRALRSHFRFKSNMVSTSCSCNLCSRKFEENTEPIYGTHVYSYFVRFSLTFCENHFHSKFVEKPGFLPFFYSFLSSFELYFFLEDFLQSIEEKIAKEIENEQNESSSCDVEKEEEEKEEEDRLHSTSKKTREEPTEKYVSGDERYSIAKLKREFTESFFEKFTKQLKEEEIYLLEHGYVHAYSLQGRRAYNEDRFAVIGDLGTMFGLQTDFVINFVGIFDGHAGIGSSEFVKTHLPGCIIGCVKNWKKDHFVDELVHSSIQKGFKKVDDSFIEWGGSYECSSGSTATVILIIDHPEWSDKKIVMANCGDTFGFIVKDGKIIGQVYNHKPGNADERKRIEDLGGRVTFLFGVPKVNGVLSVSRSIGDLSLKPYVIPDPNIQEFTFPKKKQQQQQQKQQQQQQQQEEENEFIMMENNIVSTDNNKTENEENETKKKEEEEEEQNHENLGKDFFIIATDGLWDVMSPNFVLNYICSNYDSIDESQSLAKTLCDMAFSRNSKDNITVAFSKL